MLKQVIVGKRFTHDTVCQELDAHLLKGADFNIHNFIGQTEFRYAIFQHPADFMQRLEHMHLETTFGHISGKRQRSRAGAYNSYFNAVFSHTGRQSRITRQTLRVGCKTLKIAYSNRFAVHFVVDTFRFTLPLLRAHTPAHCRKRRGLF